MSMNAYLRVVRRSLLLSAIALAPLIVRAEGAAPDAKALGTTEALAAYCAKADPGSAARFREQLSRIANGASADALAKARRSAEYQRSRSAVEDFVKKVDPHNVKKMCSESAPPAH